MTLDFYIGAITGVASYLLAEWILKKLDEAISKEIYNRTTLIVRNELEKVKRK